MRTAADWHKILVQCQVKPITAAKWSTVFAAEIVPGTFSAGMSEVDDFLGQVLHESAMLERLEENLNYSVDALLAKFGRHRISEADARRFGRAPGQPANQRMLANILYGGAWGAKNLGNTQPDDGWNFRGSGLIQATGRRNIDLVGKAIGIDLVRDPDKLRKDPAVALRASIAWWERKIPDSVMGDTVRVSRIVNGGTLGLDHRQKLTEAARKGLA